MHGCVKQMSIQHSCPHLSSVIRRFGFLGKKKAHRRSGLPMPYPYLSTSPSRRRASNQPPPAASPTFALLRAAAQALVR